MYRRRAAAGEAECGWVNVFPAGKQPEKRNVKRRWDICYGVIGEFEENRSEAEDCFHRYALVQ